ncbi:kinase-like domain-containing protein [Aspergillus heterothallicus]
MDLPSFPTTEPIASRLRQIRIENKQCKRFIADDDLFQVLADSHDQIEQLLNAVLPREDVGEVADAIFSRARKVFSILALNNHAHHIRGFLRYDQLQESDLDNSLPFDKPKLEQIMKEEYAVEAFYERQWEFCVPKFQGRIIPRSLDPHTIMPYIEESHIGSGGYGSVYRVKFYPSYQPKGFSSTDEFVRKEQLLDSTATYENEVHVLSTLQTLEHPNILRLLACYTYEDKHNLVSPYISGGTLHEFLRRDKPDNLTRERFFCMMAGIASAISALHIFRVDGEVQPGLKGHHQDLWSENILVDEDRLILADFGLSSMKRMSQNTPTRHKGRKGYYQAPECADLEAPYEEHTGTRASDIFALGCIFTDLLVYHAFGPEGTMAFREARKFTKPPFTYRVYHKWKYSHEAVEEWLEKVVVIDRSESTSEAVRLVRKMLELDPDNRPKANEVTAIVYDCAVKAYSEKIMKCFDRFSHNQGAVVEQARYSSWALYQEPIVYITNTGATGVHKQFTTIINSQTQMLHLLKSIGHSCHQLNHRSINEIRPVNLQLLNMLSPARRALAEDNFTATLLESGAQMPALDSTTSNYDIGYSAFMRRAETKRLVTMTGEAEAPSPPDSGRYQFINDDLVEGEAVNDFRVGTIARGKKPPVRVIIERIKYHDPYSWEAQGPRIQALCALLASEDVLRNFRVPPFYGARARRDNWDYELLYRFPGSDSRQGPPPISLYTLLKKNKNNRMYGPLESRMRLAAKLAEALANFHDVNWFHKNLTSSNVLFFPSPTTPAVEVTDQPYLVGFKHSRPDDEDATEGPLQNPEQQRYHHPLYVDARGARFTRFEPHFDRYSLGILLLEIGLWSPIEVIMQDYQKLGNEAFSKMVKEIAVPQLQFGMGTPYADIVEQCLTELRVEIYPTAYSGAFEQSPNFLFKQGVVIPLRSLAARRQIFGPGVNIRKRSHHEENSSGGLVRRSRPRVMP